MKSETVRYRLKKLRNPEKVQVQEVPQQMAKSLITALNQSGEKHQPSLITIKSETNTSTNPDYSKKSYQQGQLLGQSSANVGKPLDNQQLHGPSTTLSESNTSAIKSEITYFTSNGSNDCNEQTQLLSQIFNTGLSLNTCVPATSHSTISCLTTHGPQESLMQPRSRNDSVSLQILRALCSIIETVDSGCKEDRSIIKESHFFYDSSSNKYMLEQRPPEQHKQFSRKTPQTNLKVMTLRSRAIPLENIPRTLKRGRPPLKSNLKAFNLKGEALPLTSNPRKLNLKGKSRPLKTSPEATNLKNKVLPSNSSPEWIESDNNGDSGFNTQDEKDAISGKDSSDTIDYSMASEGPQATSQIAACIPQGTDKSMSVQSTSYARNSALSAAVAKKWKCDICAKCIASKRSLNDHMARIHLQEKRCLCEVCGERVFGLFELKKHQNAHHEKDKRIKSFLCETCGYGSYQLARLKEHIQNIHLKVKLQKCNICTKMLSSTTKLKDHLRTHTGEIPHKCPICSKGFITSSGLKNHLPLHTEGKNFHCNICNERFRTQSSLSRHKITNHNVKKHSCEHCGKLFAIKATLINHIRVHTKEQPFQCEICNRKFASYSNMLMHTRMHTDERPYHCDYCDKRFYNPSNLKTHQRMHAK